MELQPYVYDGDDFSFDGSVEMWVIVHKVTNKIVMNIDLIELDESSIEVYAIRI